MITTMQDAVGAAKKGNSEGQAYLYEQTYRKAYYVALKYMQNEDDAYDIVHDAYMKAFERIDQLDDDSKFEKWLNSIVASTALDALKKKKPQLFTALYNGEEEFDVSEKFEANYQEQPEVVMDQNETSRLVQEIISELSDEQRACVTMYYMQEMSVKEIGAILNVSDNTVKSRLNYARKNIEAKVKELEKKGTKLYALAPLPFFLLLINTESKACEATAVAGMFSATTGATVGTTIGSTISAESGSGMSAGATMGTTATTTGMSLGAKVAIGIVSAVVVIGGAIGVGVVIGNSFNDDDERIESEEENKTDDIMTKDNTQKDDTSSVNTTQSAQKKLPGDVTAISETGGYIGKIVDVITNEDGTYTAIVEELNSNAITVTPEEYATYHIGTQKDFGVYTGYNSVFSCYEFSNGYYFKNPDMPEELFWVSDQHKDSNGNIVVYRMYSTQDEDYRPFVNYNDSVSNAKICIDGDATIEIQGARYLASKTMKFRDFVKNNEIGSFYNQSYLQSVAGWRNTGRFSIYGDKDGFVVRLHEHPIS